MLEIDDLCRSHGNIGERSSTNFMWPSHQWLWCREGIWLDEQIQARPFFSMLLPREWLQRNKYERQACYFYESMYFLHNKVKDTKTHIQIQIQFKIKTWSLHYNIGTCYTFCLWTPPLFPCYQRPWWWWWAWWCQSCWSWWGWRGWWWLLTYTQPRCRCRYCFSRRRCSPQALRPLGRNFGLLWFCEWLLVHIHTF